ncbi:phage portal protein [Burkholderia ambifaria]|uniref:phage portal protein n=1 Tax=Burkholderia ambifaria TaxID=152480 RepID=UPI001B93DCC7|nr:phage portal protein [Burkholderia ambifaria]MBR8221296.1 phage portal protein [Burkholderia ambifaria]
MENQVSILGPNGAPLAPSRARMLTGGSRTPYDAADLYGDHVADWQPYLWSPDGELNMYRDRIVARVRDLVRNDGWASAAVTRTLDTVVGANFHPVFKPDYQALRAFSGNKGFDHIWAEEYGQALEANYRTWADDLGRYCDAQRNLTMPEIMAVAFRHELVDGDSLGQMLWLPERVGRGRARYATTVMLIDPDRLSNPQLRFDQQTQRGGVKVDEYGAAAGYYIRRAHQGDWFSAGDSIHWDLIPRETEWGRPIIVHNFTPDRAGQHRGGAGILTPVLQRLKMLIKYDGTELDAAIINAIFGAYITSPFDQNFVEESLGGGGIGAYQEGRADFHRERRIRLGGAQLTSLYPGESISTVAASRPAGNFEAFEAAMLRNVAAGAGVSAQQISQNWSDVNYSSYRAAMLEAWKTFYRRRVNFARGFAQPIAAAFVEESHEVDDLPMPSGYVPEFIECRTAYSRAKWMGPGKGYVDPTKEKEGAILGMAAGLSTLEDECADLAGSDWRENMDRQAVEIDRMRKLGIPLPDWAARVDAKKLAQPPQEPEPA